MIKTREASHLPGFTFCFSNILMFCLIMMRQCKRRIIVNMASQTQKRHAYRFVDSPIVNCDIAVVSDNNMAVLINDDKLSNGLYKSPSLILSIGVPVALL